MRYDEHLGEKVSIRSIHVALSKDDRLMRTGPKSMGTTAPGTGPQYVGMAHHIREILEERGEMPVSELFDVLARTLRGQAGDHKVGGPLPPVRDPTRKRQDETQGRPHTQEGRPQLTLGTELW